MNSYLCGMVSEGMTVSKHLYQLYFLKPQKVWFRPQAANPFQFKYQFKLVSSHFFKHHFEKESEEKVSCSEAKSVMINQQ